MFEELPESDESVAAANRRGSERRLPEVEPTFVWISLDRRIQAQLTNESDGGVGLIVPSGEQFEIGFHVRVELYGRRRTAQVVYAERTASGDLRLGLEWVDATGSNDAARVKRARR